MFFRLGTSTSRSRRSSKTSIFSARWTTAGSGRADIELKNGDLPFTVSARECWSASFQRVYYEDTVDYEPSTGAETACALPAITAP